MEDENKSFKLSGTLKKVLFSNSDTGFCIAVLDNDQKICGSYFDTDIEKIVGENIVLTGNWVTHKKYGIQFAFDTLELKEQELYFFLTKIVKGIGRKVALELLEKYNEEELVDVLNNKPEELLNFKGIREKKLTTIKASWQKFKHLRELGSFLSKFGVTSNLITKIYSEFGEVDDLIEVIKKNPYVLIRIKGIGFKRADEIAKALGIDEKSDFRIMACLNYTLKEYCDNNGNSSIDKYHLFRLLDESLRFENEEMLYENALATMELEEEIHKTKENRYSPSMLYNAELKILRFFKERENDQYLKKIVSNTDLTSGANFGLMEWGTRHNIRVKISDTGAKQIYSNVDGVYASGGTDLRTAMNNARNYFTSGQVANWNLTCSLNYLIVIFQIPYHLS